MSTVPMNQPPVRIIRDARGQPRIELGADVPKDKISTVLTTIPGIDDILDRHWPNRSIGPDGIMFAERDGVGMGVGLTVLEPPTSDCRHHSPKSADSGEDDQPDP